MAKCVGCKCTDAQACELGCWWIVVDQAKNIGVCSNCDRPETHKKYRRARNALLARGRTRPKADHPWSARRKQA